MLGRLLRSALGRASALACRLAPTAEERRVRPWHLAEGDTTLRVEYELDESSVVFDLGGYQGQWASDVFARYCCTVHVFEPVARFHADIARRFRRNPRIHVYPFGLADRDARVTLALAQDGSSIFRAGPETEEVQLVRAATFLEDEGFTAIDLMKVNIEGGEYDLLEHLLDSGWLPRIRDLQVQFHDCVPGARERMRRIQERLALTHEPSYRYEFVWENWRRMASGGVPGSSQ